MTYAHIADIRFLETMTFVQGVDNQKRRVIKEMNIPTIVRIGSCDYQVMLTDQTILLDHHPCYGMIDYNNHIIKLDTTIGDTQQREKTFLHEVIHGMINDRELKVDDEELLVNQLASAFHQFVRDNPDIFIDEASRT